MDKNEKLKIIFSGIFKTYLNLIKNILLNKIVKLFLYINSCFLNTK